VAIFTRIYLPLLTICDIFSRIEVDNRHFRSL